MLWTYAQMFSFISVSLSVSFVHRYFPFRFKHFYVNYFVLKRPIVSILLTSKCLCFVVSSSIAFEVHLQSKKIHYVAAVWDVISFGFNMFNMKLDENNSYVWCHIWHQRDVVLIILHLYRFDCIWFPAIFYAYLKQTPWTSVRLTLILSSWFESLETVFTFDAYRCRFMGFGVRFIQNELFSWARGPSNKVISLNERKPHTSSSSKLTLPSNKFVVVFFL